MAWFSDWFERTTDQGRLHRLQSMRQRMEGMWKKALEDACGCSQVVMALEAAEQELDQDVFSKDHPVWMLAQAKVQHSIAEGEKVSQQYLQEAPTARLMWTGQCLAKALEVCKERMCRPKAEPDYQEVDGVLVPVCGAMEYLKKAAEMPTAEQLYESQAQGWDPNKFKKGGATGHVADNW